ncbi:hypothetical protein ACIPLR_21200 [Herbaspirillum huttiense]|uniref:hypothetical protein n=1 Tax=Herbaspirillum huttiense TaxID=863372 RepID=UPI00380575D3
MNRHFESFINLGKLLAKEKGLAWDFPLDEFGQAADDIGWNLTVAANEVSPSAQYLRDLGTDKKTLEYINSERLKDGLSALPRRPLSSDWLDLIKAAVAQQLFYKRNKVGHAVNNIARPLKVIASCVDVSPWALNVDQVTKSIDIGKSIQASGKLGATLIAVIKNVFDENHLVDIGPLFGLIQHHGEKYRSTVKSKHTLSEEELRTQLEDRKRQEKLPSKKAFWELARIVFTEQPRTFSDELRFAAVRTMIITGLRIGEIALLPLNWKHEHHYFDSAGEPAGKSGGVSTGISIRHFAEKQQNDMSDSRVLRHATQYVPDAFREILTESLSRIEALTSPLRNTLQMQSESGRLFPWYRSDELVRFIDLYPRITGNPFWLQVDRDSFVSKYREQFDPAVLAEIDKYQSDSYRKHPTSFDSAFYVFGHRLQKAIHTRGTSLQFRSSAGEIIRPGQTVSWANKYLLICELEKYVHEYLPTKVSDLMSIPTDNGTQAPWEFLFLHPKRSLAEERNDGICDVTRYMAIGRPDPVFIASAVGDHPSIPSLFKGYCTTEADRSLSLTSHTIRHMQNTELFRLGVADTIISKRYNRRSVAQSYEYDHRSLSEDLDSMEITEDIELMLGPKATTVAKMIMAD